MKKMTEYDICRKQFMIGNKLNFALTIFFQGMVAIFMIGIAYPMMLVIESMETVNSNGFIKAFVVLAIVAIGMAIFGNLLRVVQNIYIKKGLLQFKSYLFKKILSKSIGEYNGALSGKFISVFSNDLNLIEKNYLNGTITIIYYIVMFLFAMLAMAFINPIIAIVTLFSCIVPIVISLVYGKQLIEKEQKTSDENSGFVSQIKDLLSGFYIIKSFQAEEEVINLFGKQNNELEEAKRNGRDVNDIAEIAGLMSMLFVIFIVFALGTYFTFTGTMTIATVIACVQISNYITEPIRMLVPLCSARKASMSLIEKIAVTLEETKFDVRKSQEMKIGEIKSEDVNFKESKFKEIKSEVKAKIKISTIDTGIEFNNVTLKFDNNYKVLDQINISFEKGKSYAIVGASGCGKSTLLQMILGYYNDYSGQLRIGKNELREIEIDSLYDVISVIQQNVFLFDETIKNNITMFKSFDEDKMKKAISYAGLSDIINEKGENYNCGESGSKLSGGEKQRVSIARCLIRETDVLLVDEATASLDNATAYQVEKEILGMDNLTRIIVTHKLEESLLKKYDEIIVMKEGKIIEKGNFHDLIAQKEYFYALYNVTKVVSVDESLAKSS